MKVKLDENLSRSHAGHPHARGHDALTVHDEGIAGCTDEQLWQRVLDEGRLLITLDLGFSDIRRFAPGTHPGILLLRPSSSGPRAVAFVLERVLAAVSPESLAGGLAVADEQHTRLRRPISGSGGR